MERLIYSDLKLWKKKTNRLPLILKGARQVGKSYILNEFGTNEFDNCYKFDFERDSVDLIPLFSSSLSATQILSNLSFYVGKDINPKKDIIIFDEIQNCARALTSLKYFAEEMPELAVCCAGSLLGITLINESFPVGKVDFLELFPMTFEELLMQTKQSQLLNSFRYVTTKKELPFIAHKKLWDILKEFYVVG